MKGLKFPAVSWLSTFWSSQWCQTNPLMSRTWVQYRRKPFTSMCVCVCVMWLVVSITKWICRICMCVKPNTYTHIQVCTHILSIYRTRHVRTQSFFIFYENLHVYVYPWMNEWMNGWIDDKQTMDSFPLGSIANSPQRHHISQILKDAISALANDSCCGTGPFDALNRSSMGRS